ncbi:NAD(P)/FAD-dependent oxidoreductase [Sporosarcina sp. CAU 1771]
MKNYIVIGSGILGASTAYHLAKKGVAVTVIDRKDIGQATDAAAGIICPWISQRRNKAWYGLAKAGAAYYSSLIDQLHADGETDTGYEQVGAISLHSDVDKLKQMVKRATERREDAPEIGDIEQLTSEETVDLFPPLTDNFGSVRVSGAARVNGRALRDALNNAAKKHGAEYIYGSAKLLFSSNQVTGVQVGEEVYTADTVLVTAGAWADELLEPLGVDVQIFSQKAQIIHLQLETKDTNTWPVVMPPHDQYIVPFDDGRIVIGATHENDFGFDQRITAGGLHEVLDKALATAPGLAEGEFAEARVGFRPFTPGFLPVIGAIPGVEGLLMANGLGASGLTVGPFLGEQLAKLACGEPLEIELDLYSVSPKVLES